MDMNGALGAFAIDISPQICLIWLSQWPSTLEPIWRSRSHRFNCKNKYKNMYENIAQNLTNDGQFNESSAGKLSRK
jgi:hypothetical protein